MASNSETEITNDVLTRYLNLMTEIKKREEVIIGMHDGTCNAKYKIINYEVMFFQLRKILEIIAKSPMLINESEYRTISDRPEEDWRIKDIMKKLEKINPDFYPKPIEIIERVNKPDKFVSKTGGYLTKDELVDAYEYSNGFLHANNPLKKESSLDFDFEWNFIVGIIEKIHLLLNPHNAKPTVDGNFYYIGMSDKKGNPHGNLFSLKN